MTAKPSLFNRLTRLFSSPASVPQNAREFKIPQGVRVYAVGDVHGRSRLLGRMLAAIEKDAGAHPEKKVIQVFLGDYVDRGFESREVLDLLLAPPPAGHERICLLGNHEEVLMRFLEDPKVLRDWANFGGYATLASYGVAIPPSMSPETLFILRDALKQNMPPAHLDFLRSLRRTHSIGDYLFVHAGILPGVPLHEQKPEHLLWIRDPFLRHREFFEQYVVHGHSPVATPEIYSNRANLDVSAAAVNSLCCLVIEGIERKMMVVTSEND